MTLGGASLKVVQESEKEGLQGRCRCQRGFNRGIKGWLKGRDQGEEKEALKGWLRGIYEFLGLRWRLRDGSRKGKG